MWRRVSRFHFIFRTTPFLRLAAVGNTLAFGWPEKDSDIDLFIVASKHRIFTTRFFLTLFMTLCGVRRHGTRIARRFCLSFFADESALDFTTLKIEKADPYLAFWLATLTPVWLNSNIFLALTSANPWVKKYFPNLTWTHHTNNSSRRNLMRIVWEFLLKDKFGDHIEAMLRRWQINRARKKQVYKKEATAVIISDKILKFHETDRRREFFRHWKKLSSFKSKNSKITSTSPKNY